MATVQMRLIWRDISANELIARFTCNGNSGLTSLPG